MHKQLRTTPARMNAGTTKPKASRGYVYSGTKADKRRKDPQAELREAAQELRHVASERGHSTASGVPAPAPIFGENKPATRANADGTLTPAPIWPQEAPRTHTNAQGFLDPGGVFDQPEGAHTPKANSAGVPVPRSIFDNGDNR